MVGKREAVSPNVAVKYLNQVSKLLSSYDDMDQPQTIYKNLIAKIDGKGEASTRYSYLATLQNFMGFLELNHPKFRPEKRTNLQKHITQWMCRQRTKKEKRVNIAKEESRQKLKSMKFPFQAIKEYEKIYEKELEMLHQKETGTLKKETLEILMGDIFLRVICKGGCCPSVLTGMKLKELEKAERTKQNNYSILVNEQKVDRHV